MCAGREHRGSRQKGEQYTRTLSCLSDGMSQGLCSLIISITVGCAGAGDECRSGFEEKGESSKLHTKQTGRGHPATSAPSHSHLAVFIDDRYIWMQGGLGPTQLLLPLLRSEIPPITHPTYSRLLAVLLCSVWAAQPFHNTSVQQPSLTASTAGRSNRGTFHTDVLCS